MCVDWKSLISYLFPWDFLNPVSMLILRTLFSVPSQSSYRLLFSAVFWPPDAGEARRTWCCLTVPLALSSPGKSCLSLRWRVIGAALPYFDRVGQGWTQVIDGLRVLKKSLRFEIGGYETREAGQKSLGCSYQEGRRQRIQREPTPTGLNSHRNLKTPCLVLCVFF